MGIPSKKSMILKQQRAPKFSSRQYNRCKLCGRPHAYLRDYGICRICFRELAYKGYHDVHAADLVDLVVLDLREDQLLLHAPPADNRSQPA